MDKAILEGTIKYLEKLLYLDTNLNLLELGEKRDLDSLLDYYIQECLKY